MVANETRSAASPLDNYPFETLLFDNVSLLNVNIDEGHHARAKHRQQRYDSLRAGILPSLQRDDNVDVKTYWNIVENVSRMARNVSVQRYEEATVTTTGPGPRYTYRQSQRGADSSNPLNGSVVCDLSRNKTLGSG